MKFRYDRTLRWLFCVGLWGALTCVLMPASALAQSNVSFSSGMDYSTNYFYRGIVQETKGLILQPYGEVAFELDSVSLAVGVWNSMHSGPSGPDLASTNVEYWYESDFYAGLGFSLGDLWAADVAYTVYMSPNDAFSTVQEIAVGLSFDDSASALPLAPSATLAIEASGNAAGTDEGVYLGLGVEPSLALGTSEASLSFPFTLGLSLSNYYQDASGSNEMFGYFDIGINASFPIADGSYGSWGFAGGVHLNYLGSSLKALNGGSQTPIIVSVGISNSF